MFVSHLPMNSKYYTRNYMPHVAVYPINNNQCVANRWCQPCTTRSNYFLFVDLLKLALLACKAYKIKPIFTPLECLPHPKSPYIPFNIAFGNAPSLIGQKSQRGFRFKHVIFGNIIIMSILLCLALLCMLESIFQGYQIIAHLVC